MENFEEILKRDDIVKIVISSPLKKDEEIKKIVIKKIQSKKIFFSEERFAKDKVYNKNYENLLENAKKYTGEYKQILIICSDFSFHCLVSKKGAISILKKKNEKHFDAQSEINNKKNYILKEEMPIDAFVDLGIFTKDYKIIKSKYEKYKQINKFIEFIDSKIKKEKKKKLKIIDFGCGKSYLTFFVYYYCNIVKGIEASIIGYDLKEDVVVNCNEIARKYGYSKLKFVVADITKSKEVFKDVDVIITLHACDIATDYALYYAIQNQVKYVFSVPCCQHEVRETIKENNNLSIVLKSGILKDRFCAVLTDAIRVELLRENGYKTEISEFVDTEGSLKNLMIIAEKTNNGKKDCNKVKELIDYYGFSQKLYGLLENK